MTINRLDIIKQAVANVQTSGTKQATKRADKKLIKLVDSVLASEYSSTTSKAERVELLDFND